MLEASITTTPTCICCGFSITDKYVYKVTNDLYLHEKCLKCNECGCKLEENSSCYLKDNRVYCKLDYTRINTSCKCTRCNQTIKANDLVMKFKTKLNYHLDCFYCDLCNKKLLPGDEFQLKDNNLLLCKEDSLVYQQESNRQFNNSNISAHTFDESSYSPSGGSSIESPHVHSHVYTYNNSNILEYDYQNIDDDLDDDDSSSENNVSIKIHSKYSNKNSLISHHHQLQQQHQHSSSSSSSPSPNMNQYGSNTKPARIRTVLNEKQLQMLRACYGANPRPDALMKEQLVEMTGLSPRVIRVWFQNKRCKDKKKTMLVRHDQHPNHPQLMFDNCF